MIEIVSASPPLANLAADPETKTEEVRTGILVLSAIVLGLLVGDKLGLGKNAPAPAKRYSYL